MAGDGSPILSPAAFEAAQRLSHMNVVSRGLGTSQSGTFAGEPARVLEQTCAGATIVGRSLVHSGRALELLGRDILAIRDIEAADPRGAVALAR